MAKTYLLAPARRSANVLASLVLRVDIAYVQASENGNPQPVHPLLIGLASFIGSSCGKVLT